LRHGVSSTQPASSAESTCRKTKSPAAAGLFVAYATPALSLNEPIWRDASGATLDVRLRTARHDRVPPTSDTGSPAFRTAIFGSFGPAQRTRRLERLSRQLAYATAPAAGGRRPRVTAP